MYDDDEDVSQAKPPGFFGKLYLLAEEYLAPILITGGSIAALAGFIVAWSHHWGLIPFFAGIVALSWGFARLRDPELRVNPKSDDDLLNPGACVGR